MKHFILFSFILFSIFTSAQETIKLWPDGKMPNSKGIAITDSISDERIRRVGAPTMMVFTPDTALNNGTAVIICPGGGYKHYAYISSGTEVAKWFNSIGVTAFVLIARLPHSADLIERSSAPLQDAQRAIRIIRGNAKKWNIDPNRVGVMGFSAGGHLASTLGTHLSSVAHSTDEVDSISTRPDFMVLVSPVITLKEWGHKGSRENLLGENPSSELINLYSNELQVTDKTPPTLLFHADNDKSVSPQNSIAFYNALREKGVSASLHIFPYGGHAIGMKNNPGSTALWMNICEAWLKEMNFLTK